MPFEQIVLVGAGNVGRQLGRRFKERGVRIAQVYSRSMENATALADELGCPATAQLQALLPLDHCLYLIAVNDDSIASVARQMQYISGSRRAFAHTSGSVPAAVLGPGLQRFGVFYPLQTLSSDRRPDFDQIPICIHSLDQALAQELFALGRKISRRVVYIDDHQRSTLHLAAVFVNNFSNYLFSVGKDIVEQEGLSFDLLRPLIAETAAKVMNDDPDRMQTGPARRGDQTTILSHLRRLQPFPAYQDLYRVISHSITLYFSKNKGN